MPRFTRTGLNDPLRIALMQQAPTLDFHFQHRRRNVACEHDVAAPAQHEQTRTRQGGVGEHVLHILRTAHAYQSLGTCRNTKSVTSLQGGVFLD